MQPERRLARSLTVSDDATVYAKHRDELLRYATALVGPHDADDVVSTVVLRTLRRRRLADLDNPRGYLLRAVLNEDRGLHRRRPPRLDAPGVVEPPSAEVAHVLAALADLPPRQRAAIYLHYWEMASVAEIGEALGVRPGTVKRYLHLARRRLKGALR